MSESEGVVALDVQLKVAIDTSPSNYQLVGECIDVNLDGESVEFAEFTHQQSTSGYREYKPSFKVGGNVTTSMNWTDDTQQATLKTAYDNQDELYWQIVWPNGKTSTFKGYVANLGVAGGMGNPLRRSLTIRITGAIAEA